ncbi:MAG: hypothetical protein M1605_00165 [Candidatus Thermoplasmatota archaeon]|nr:hypothetical protein [Candidatus Thermoplasmatota archaeon]
MKSKRGKKTGLAISIFVCALVLFSYASVLGSGVNAAHGSNGLKDNQPALFENISVTVTIQDFSTYFPNGALWGLKVVDMPFGYYSSTNLSFSAKNTVTVLGDVGYGNYIEIITYPPAGFNITNGSYYFPDLPPSINITENAYPALYPVVFNETGLPPATHWGMNITQNGKLIRSISGDSSSNIIALTAGTYQYSISPVPGYVSDQPLTGTFTVLDQPSTINLYFSIHRYDIFLMENGLPSGTEWSAEVGGIQHSTTESSMEYSLANGTYNAYVLPVQGYSSSKISFSISVNGSSIYQIVSFSKKLYSLSFIESGLPEGTYWNVAVNGTERSSSGSAVSFMLSNGTYAYHVFPVPGYHIDGAVSGSVSVSGAQQTVHVDFHMDLYPVVLNETGLQTYMHWNVSIAGIQSPYLPAGTGTVFMLPNGTYTASVSGPAGYSHYLNGQKPISVDGHGLSLMVSFYRNVYPVNITETGLPSGSGWILNFSNGISTGLTYSSQYEIMLPNGSFPYSLQTYNHSYRPVNYHGTVAVNGNGTAVTLKFIPEYYLQSFVIFNGSTSASLMVLIGGNQYRTGNPVLSVMLQNGTYQYTAYYGSRIIYGSITVNGTDSMTLIGSAETISIGSGSGTSAIGMSGIILTLFAIGSIVMFRRR